MKSKRDIDIKHQYLRDLKEQFSKGIITRDELHSYVLNELKTKEPEEDLETTIRRFFKGKD